MHTLRKTPHALSHLIPLSLVALGSVLLTSLCAPRSALASTGGCPNSALVGERGYLPNCRAYELVSPTFTSGFIVGQTTRPPLRSPNGLRVIAESAGSFSGDESGVVFSKLYQMERKMTSSGWTTTAITPPASFHPNSPLTFVDASSTLDKTLWAEIIPAGAPPETLRAFYTRDSTGRLEEVGPIVAKTTVLQSNPRHYQNNWQYEGSSTDLQTVFYSVERGSVLEEARAIGEGNGSRVTNPLWPGDTTIEGGSLYEYVGTKNTEPTLVGVRQQPTGGLHRNENAELISQCGVMLGSRADKYNAVAASGERVFFTAEPRCEQRGYVKNPATGEYELKTFTGAGPEVAELWARQAYEPAVPISEPSKEDCPECQTSGETPLHEAVFQGASANGEKVFFLTEQELLRGQTGLNLYEYNCGVNAGQTRISLVSMGSSEPRVQGVVRVAENGARVYFVAEGVLTGANEEGQRPEESADNMYVYDTEDGRLTFVATLLTGGVRNEIVSLAEANAFALGRELNCAFKSASEECYQAVLARYEEELGALQRDESVWARADQRPAQATPNGEVLVFPASARLTTGDASAATSPQLFAYDSASERLSRVSVAEPGFGAGNTNGFREAPEIAEPRYNTEDSPAEASSALDLSEGGTMIVFASEASLGPVVPGSVNVYEYAQGTVALITDGEDAGVRKGAPDVQLYGMDPGGGDIFFSTADALVPAVADSQLNIYDARIGGGVGLEAEPVGCGIPSCFENMQGPEQLGAAESASQQPGDNVGRERAKVQRKRKRVKERRRLKHRLKRCKMKRQSGRRMARGCRALLRRDAMGRRPIGSKRGREIHDARGER